MNWVEIIIIFNTCVIVFYFIFFMNIYYLFRQIEKTYNNHLVDVREIKAEISMMPAVECSFCKDFARILCFNEKEIAIGWSCGIDHIPEGTAKFLRFKE